MQLCSRRVNESKSEVYDSNTQDANGGGDGGEYDITFYYYIYV